MTKTFSYNLADGNIAACECCGSIAPTAIFKRYARTERGYPWRLCKICADTNISTIVEYSTAGQDPALFKALAQVGNAVIDATTIRRRALKALDKDYDE